MKFKEQSPTASKIQHKWGFGMAPIKETTNEKRINSIGVFLKLYNQPKLPPSEDLLDAISAIKGLFTLIWKQDQWDWFTVFDRIGRPGVKKSRAISTTFKHLRKVLRDQENLVNKQNNLQTLLIELKKNKIERHLKCYTGEWQLNDIVGQIYILSTREQPKILKIGYTERSVWDRVKEINRSTGVLTPYGVRAAWAIESAKLTEKEIHKKFENERIRKDREFFCMDFKEAFKEISKLIIEKRIKET